MKGKIDKHGFLYIERNNQYKEQECPTQEEVTRCGDWCPLFGEPDLIPKLIKSESIPEFLKNSLNLCHKTLYFDHFTDERKDPNNYEMDLQADLVQEICKRYWDLQERIEIVENIAKQIDSNEYESIYNKKSDSFAKYTINIMQATKGILENLESDVIEFDDNEGE